MKLQDVLMLVALVVIVLVGVCGYKIGYVTGQLDALDGKQKVHYVTNTVEKVTWQYIK